MCQNYKHLDAHPVMSLSPTTRTPSSLKHGIWHGRLRNQGCLARWQSYKTWFPFFFLSYQENMALLSM